MLALEKRYADLKMPVVIVAGQEDRLVDIDKQSARLHEDVTHSTLHRVPGAGHMAHQTATDAVMVAVDEAAGARLENGRISAKQRLASITAAAKERIGTGTVQRMARSSLSRPLDSGSEHQLPKSLRPLALMPKQRRRRPCRTLAP